MSTAFHPQTDGQSERTIRTLEQMLKCALQEFQDQNWEDLLPYKAMFYNITSSSSTDKSPFEIVYGKEFKVPGRMSSALSDAKEELLTPTVEQHLQKLRKVQETVADNLTRARQK